MAHSDVLDPSTVRTVDVDGVRTRYVDVGEGEPLVLLSGGEYGILYALDHWSLNIDALSTTFRVIALDKLGQGHTDNPSRPGDYTFESLLRHTQRFLEVLDIDRAHVVGHSRGALLACWLAHREPDLVTSLVIVDTASVVMAGDADIERYAELGLLGGFDPDVEPTLDSVAIEPRGQAADPSTVTEDFLERLLEIARLSKTAACQRVMRDFGGSTWGPSIERHKRENLDRIGAAPFAAPVLVVWGADDKTAPLDLGLQLYRLVQAMNVQAEMHVLGGAGHCSFRDRATAFNRLVTEFCSRDQRPAQLRRGPG